MECIKECRQGKSQILLKIYNHNDPFLEEAKSGILDGVGGSSWEGGMGPWSFQRITHHGFYDEIIIYTLCYISWSSTSRTLMPCASLVLFQSAACSL